MGVADGVDAHDIFVPDFRENLRDGLIEVVVSNLTAVGMPDGLDAEVPGTVL